MARICDAGDVSICNENAGQITFCGAISRTTQLAKASSHPAIDWLMLPALPYSTCSQCFHATQE